MLVLGLLSASVERFNVSCMRDFSTGSGQLLSNFVIFLAKRLFYDSFVEQFLVVFSGFQCICSHFCQFKFPGGWGRWGAYSSGKKCFYLSLPNRVDPITQQGGPYNPPEVGHLGQYEHLSGDQCHLAIRVDLITQQVDLITRHGSLFPKTVVLKTQIGGSTSPTFRSIQQSGKQTNMFNVGWNIEGTLMRVLFHIVPIPL